MKELISHKTTELKKYKELEELTGITAATWRSWWNRGSTPSGELIEAACKLWPNYAFWLVTGITDQYHGHDSPKLSKNFRRRTAAYDLFEKKIEFEKWREKNPVTDAESDQYFRDNLAARDSKILESNLTADSMNRIQQMDEFHHEITTLTHIRDDQEAALLRAEDQSSQIN
ncbi:hypothetical protein [Undibacterium danionis]|uniref:XRE family transcriptional regulator n=1 Tax=Undibacterium danionis TaxID=1812100 RepID=A0ABV6ICY8_9BURK